LDEELNNNVGSVTELAVEALKDTNWEVDVNGSDKIF
jgi:hypothetical protein